MALTASVALTTLLGLLPMAALAESEDEVKAAFLFNFARYVEWPTSVFARPDAAIRLCLMDGAGFDELLGKAVSGRSVGDHPVEVASVDGLGDVDGCHLLYLGEHVELTGEQVAARLGATPVFTLSDREGFAADGGIANFMLIDQKIRFAINPAAAREAGLRISSSLLRLAKIVGEGGA